MKKFLKHILIASALSICLMSLLVYPGSCQDFPKIEVLFSPEKGQEILETLEDAIRDAEERIYILIFSFTLDEIAKAIIEKHGEGLDVKIIMDKSQAGSQWAVTDKLKEAGIPLVVKGGTKGGYMHIKALIADDMVLTGSYNYSKNATNRNDENFLIIKDEDVLEIHLAKFNRLWGLESSTITPETDQEKKRAPPEEEKININTATKEELLTLPGIGEILAGRIIDYRNTHGPFKSIHEILKIERIGEGTFNKIKDKIVVDQALIINANDSKLLKEGE